MKKRHLILFALVIAVLAITLSGCGREELDLEGKHIVTFELGGGILILPTADVNADMKISYAYEPGTYILDPVKIPGNSITRDGYVFTGWYKTAECNPADKWDFEKTPFNTPELTLYAGWEKAIKYTFTVSYKDADGNTQDLGSYSVSASDVFEDWKGYADKRKGFTALGFYQDADCENPWDFSTTHPGGETDTDVKVYVDYIEGEWSLVDNYKSLVTALNNGKNVYVVSDIDCGGSAINVKNEYKATFNGNNFTVTNFTVAKTGTSRNPVCAIFDNLGDGAEIMNVNFTGVCYEFTGISAAVNTAKVAALARTAGNAKISGVTIEGSILTDSESELSRINEAIYENGSEAEITDFVANITVNKKS